MSWQALLGAEKQKPYFIETLTQVEHARQSGQVIYPPQSDVFNAFKLTDLAGLKVVILGQDPYHGPNQAHGLAFSVRKGVRTPPSLQNMYKELALEYPDFTIPSHGCLEDWAKQGVLLLNTVLTVVATQANSHRHLGWEQFTDAVIEKINKEKENVVFLLWGNYAISKSKFIDQEKHFVLTSVHPSPLSASRGFFGNKHFSRTNEFLVSKGLEPINW